MLNPILLNIDNPLETNRLILRAPQSGDGTMINDAIRESFVTLSKWLRWADHVPDVEESEENARKSQARFILRESLTFYVLNKVLNTFVGVCSLQNINWERRKGEIGYWLRDSASGYGYMSEAVSSLTDLASDLFFNRVEIRVAVDNERSRNVAERCGFHLEATLVNNLMSANRYLRDECVYVKVRLNDGTLGYPGL